MATRIQEEEPSAIHVHCLAHCLNLCLQDVARQCKPVRDALDLVNEILKLVKASPKRWSQFSRQHRWQRRIINGKEMTRASTSCTHVLQEAGKMEHVEDPKLPRRKKVPRRTDDGAENHVYLTPTVLYVHIKRKNTFHRRRKWKRSSDSPRC